MRSAVARPISQHPLYDEGTSRPRTAGILIRPYAGHSLPTHCKRVMVGSLVARDLGPETNGCGQGPQLQGEIMQDHRMACGRPRADDRFRAIPRS